MEHTYIWFICFFPCVRGAQKEMSILFVYSSIMKPSVTKNKKLGQNESVVVTILVIQAMLQKYI